MLATLKNADVVAWISFGLGVAVLIAGVVVGLVTSLKKAPEATKQKIDEAKDKIDETKSNLAAAQAQAGAGGAAAAAGAPAAADAAATSADAAKTALEQVGDIVGSLPENLRFAGLLVLIGAVLMSVATIQFGGTSIF